MDAEKELGRLIESVNKLMKHANEPFANQGLLFNESYLETFRLAAFGFTNKEIAEQQDISASNVGTRLWTLKKNGGLNKSDLTKEWFRRFFVIAEQMNDAYNALANIVHGKESAE